MEIYYDTEFIDTGSLVHLLSIGMVAEDGREYYAINDDAYVIKTACTSPWLRENVLAYFPLAQPLDKNHPVADESHEDYIHMKSIRKIAQEVKQFIWDTANPSLWAWFSAYDHLMLSQLYGKMLDLPPGIPQRTNDVAQEAERLGNIHVPHMPNVKAHKAIDDAWEVKWRREWIRAYEIERNKTWLKNGQ